MSFCYWGGSPLLLGWTATRFSPDGRFPFVGFAFVLPFTAVLFLAVVFTGCRLFGGAASFFAAGFAFAFRLTAVASFGGDG